MTQGDPATRPPVPVAANTAQPFQTQSLGLMTQGDPATRQAGPAPANTAAMTGSTTGVMPQAATATASAPPPAANAAGSTPQQQYQPVSYNPQGYQPTYAQAANTGSADQFQQRISSQLDTLQQPVSANSDVVRAQTDPFRVAMSRALAGNRDALAEQSYASGNLGSGGYDQQQQRAREDASNAIATNQGQVMATAEAQRQSQLANLLGLGQSGALQQEGITNQSNQFNSTLGLNAAQLNAQSGLAAAQLAANQQQFGVTSGQNQQALNNALEIARMQNALGYYQSDNSRGLGEDQLYANGGF